MVAGFVPRRDVTSWGRVVREEQRVARPAFSDTLPALLRERPAATVLAVGKLRSYGDTVLNSGGCLIAMDGLDRFVAFDAQSGVLRADAGVTLDQVLQAVVAHGWFLPTTPGTRFVTLGGAVANDVHGKNHHRAGTFGCHVTALGLLRGNGERITVSPQSEPELFAATIGGLGLTGIIEWVEISLVRIASSDLKVTLTPFDSLEEFWTLASTATEAFEHTVAWIDCTAREARLGRGIFSAANWCPSGALKPHRAGARAAVPVDAPSRLLNSLSIGVFNRAYYWLQSRKAGESVQHYAPFFYPLDSIGQWNRLYGKAGFWQYQCVLPPATMRDGTGQLLAEISRSGQGSFLAVLKTFGSRPSPGLMSFPSEGATLALDFANRGSETLRLFDRLDAIVREGGGRLYAAKDGRIPAAIWAAGYPNLEKFSAHIDPAFSSDFWRRVT